MNPELRQTLQHFTHNVETANRAAQENIYTFTQLYIDPCLSGFKSCLTDCTAPCLPIRDETLRRRRGRGRSRGRAEHFFDFYDDWDDEEDVGTAAIAGWGNDELDSLLAGQGQTGGTYNTTQPPRQRAMSYGSRGRRKSASLQDGAEDVPVPIPGSNYFGFLERLPWNIVSRVLKYRPSAANLQEHPGGLRMADAEAEAYLHSQEGRRRQGHNRQRSDTQNSRSTMASLSSRGDLILSEEEEDAVPLDDEFAVLLGRRTTNPSVPSEDHSSSKTGSSGRRPGPSRRNTRTPSAKSVMSRRSTSQKSLTSPMSPAVEEVPPPLPTQSMSELRQEEEQIRYEEEMEIQQKREAAQSLATAKGLDGDNVQIPTTMEVKSDERSNSEEMPDPP